MARPPAVLRIWRRAICTSTREALAPATETLANCFWTRNPGLEKRATNLERIIFNGPTVVRELRLIIQLRWTRFRRRNLPFVVDIYDHRFAKK